MINRVILVGNLGLDPEVRALQSGQAVANFSIATNRRFKDSDGARQQRTDWHSVVAYGKQAELVGRLLTRGRLIYLEGRIETQTWEDKASHEKRSKTIIVCETFQLLGAKPADNDQAADEGDQAPDTRHGPGTVRPSTTTSLSEPSGLSPRQLIAAGRPLARTASLPLRVPTSPKRATTSRHQPSRPALRTSGSTSTPSPCTGHRTMSTSSALDAGPRHCQPDSRSRVRPDATRRP